MSYILDAIGPEFLSALELENLPYLTSVYICSVYTLASANINHSAPNLVTIYVNIRSQMSFIMLIIGPSHWLILHSSIYKPVSTRAAYRYGISMISQ